MTKPKTKPCICCRHFNGGSPCAKGHKPRFYKDKGLCRVCDDFATGKPEPVNPSWLNRFLSIFNWGV